ncbi:3-oxoadipate enol-lactone hydrolase/4-carboxymuconolactone decarboxylase [Nitrospirillum viridazoti Y2]|uniref:4-carboxymuconolactone decarboxylase /3-oxoadipate enol-lactonase n=1 Tax=Nitrospirillum amazonense TaxID=28077 RepID=A0A560INQ9_9PROT|nr:alpha/beta fold hydrolase [Nitrospirillum amazonense]EGX99503.1 3-oxoadipate enol-lactone hydrolase/4-carboxymuconolactone decarboxylase [Nitrospirillum amazonense Y2]TWB60673.1 4-carboxymuconolactone decarboxylase /3-oxoadipate enol-lactonase [Nitrospirillum amazonense]
MPFAVTQRGRLYWRQDGASSRPALVLLHPALFDHTVWDRMIPFLVDHFRVIRVDLPGHGASGHLLQDCTMADLAGDILSVLDNAGIDRALVCGHAFGALVGLEMAAARPHRICGVVAGLGPDDSNTDMWAQHSHRDLGLTVGELVDAFFKTALPIQQQDRLAMWLDPLRQSMLSTTLDGYRQCAAWHAATNTRQLIIDCKVPGTIVLAADYASTAPWREFTKLSVAKSAGGCLPPVEAPGDLATIIARLHDRIQPDGAGLDPARNGERVRRDVLGDAWVDRSLAARDAWNRDYQDYATEVAWHTIWGRKGLDYRTRRLLVLALTSALGRWEEFRFHARLGIERGSLTIQDIKEVSLQTGLYAGVPVSNTAFNEARAIFPELGIGFHAD